jgi:site-specific DNA recombinase
VLAQVHAALKAPEVVQAVCDRVAAKTPKVTEPEVVLALRQLGNVWEQLFPAERQRIVHLLIERVTLLDSGIEIGWRDAGWSQLVGELLPGTIGAELRELEPNGGGLA